MYHLIEDLNEDGLFDILVVLNRTINNTKSFWISIFTQTASGFKSEADQSFEVIPEAAVLDIANVSATPGKEIVLLTSKDVQFYNHRLENIYEEKPRVLIKEVSVFQVPDKSSLPNWNFAIDLNGNSWDEVLIPQFDGFALYKRKNSPEYQKVDQLNIPLEASIYSSSEITTNLEVYFRLPKIIFLDYNLDQRRDILVLNYSGLHIYYQDEGGIFSTTDTGVGVTELGFGYTNTSSISVGPSGIAEKERKSIGYIGDLNSDGITDILVNNLNLSRGLVNPTKQFQLFLGKQKIGKSEMEIFYDNTPDHIIVNKGFQLGHSLIDLNADGLQDIAIPLIQVNLFDLIGMLISGHIDMDILFYLMNPTGKYANKPDFNKSVSIKFSLSGNKGNYPVIRFDGDFNSDGFPDFLTNDGQKELQIYYNNKKGLVSDKPNLTINTSIPLNGQNVITANLNNDYRNDIIIIREEEVSDSSDVAKNSIIVLMIR